MIEEKSKKFMEALNYYIRPQTFPLAIKMLKKLDEVKVPPKIKKPASELGFKVAICQAIGMARRYGWAFMLTKEDISCPLALIVFGFEKRGALYESGYACAGFYTETLEAGSLTEAQTPKFDYSEYEGILIAPIFKATFKPDLYIIYGNSAQIMRLIQSTLYKTGGRVKSSSSGRIDCGDEIIETLKSKECRYIIPCYGDRLFGLASDNEIAFTVPYERVDDIIYGLEGTHKGGIRYPTPFFMRWEAQFPEAYMRVLEDREDP